MLTYNIANENRKATDLYARLEIIRKCQVKIKASDACETSEAELWKSQWYKPLQKAYLKGATWNNPQQVNFFLKSQVWIFSISARCAPI